MRKLVEGTFRALGASLMRESTNGGELDGSASAIVALTALSMNGTYAAAKHNPVAVYSAN